MNASAASQAQRGAAAHAGVLTFCANVKLPSLENYRGRGRVTPATSEKGLQRRSKAERQYTRIVHAKELIGWKCRQAARPGQLARIFGQRVSIEIGLYDQDIDADNVKLVVDALKNIFYPDDRKEFVQRVSAEHGEDDLFEEPTVIVRVAVWE